MSDTHDIYKRSDLEKGDGSIDNGDDSVAAVPTTAAHIQDFDDDVPRNKGIFGGVCLSLSSESVILPVY